VSRDAGAFEHDLRRVLGNAHGTPVLDHVLQFDIDLGDFGRVLGAELDSEPPEEGPNTLNRFGRPLDEGPWSELGGIVVTELLEPLRRAHFSEVLPDPLDAHYAYLIEYGDDADADLPLHVDASHLTLNLCLGDEFDGGDLVFEGLRCEAHRELPPEALEVCALEHRPGRAYVHLGAHRHRVTAVDEGRRRNLIVWARNEAASATLGGNGPCLPWCGRHAPRSGTPD
jgi:hypothetical protein